jgi:hypothetical protein
MWCYTKAGSDCRDAVTTGFRSWSKYACGGTIDAYLLSDDLFSKTPQWQESCTNIWQSSTLAAQAYSPTIHMMQKPLPEPEPEPSGVFQALDEDMFSRVLTQGSWRRECSEQRDCAIGEYCDSDHICSDCGEIKTAASCDAIGAGGCCTDKFRRQCPTNPFHCKTIFQIFFFNPM